MRLRVSCALYTPLIPIFIIPILLPRSHRLIIAQGSKLNQPAAELRALATIVVVIVIMPIPTGCSAQRSHWRVPTGIRGLCTSNA